MQSLDKRPGLLRTDYLRHVNGKLIVFQSERDGNAEIYTMKTSGKKQTRLTDNPASDGRPMA